MNVQSFSEPLEFPVDTSSRFRWPCSKSRSGCNTKSGNGLKVWGNIITAYKPGQGACACHLAHLRTVPRAHENKWTQIAGRTLVTATHRLAVVKCQTWTLQEETNFTRLTAVIKFFQSQKLVFYYFFLFFYFFYFIFLFYLFLFIYLFLLFILFYINLKNKNSMQLEKSHLVKPSKDNRNLQWGRPLPPVHGRFAIKRCSSSSCMRDNPSEELSRAIDW